MTLHRSLMQRPTHRHALRAALAVTGRARRPLLLCCVLMGGLSACGLPDDATTQEPWALNEDASHDLAPLPDMTPDTSASVDMRASVDMNAAIEMSALDMAAEETPDMPDIPDASHDADMSPEDMPDDVHSPDLEDVESCLDEAGHTDWECCERTKLAGQGCGFCASSFDPERPIDCLSCYSADDQWTECCDRLRPLLDASIDQFDPLGCAPWGPPAPPSYAARTSLLHTLLRPCPSHFRREKRRFSHATA